MSAVAVAVWLLVVICSQVNANYQFEIISTRPLDRSDASSDSRNLIRLECRSKSGTFGSQFIATFYRNSTPFMLSSPEDSQTLSFVVDRFSDEGLYSCGADVEDSEGISVIGQYILVCIANFTGHTYTIL